MENEIYQNLINSKEYQNIISNRLRNQLNYLINQSINFELMVKSKEIFSNHKIPKEFFDDEEFILLNFSGYTFDNMSLYENNLYFGTYLKLKKKKIFFLEIYYNSIFKIIVDGKEIFNNICVFSEEKFYLKEKNKENSRENFIKNKKNKKFFTLS